MSLLRINHHPSRRQLVVFAVAWLVFFALAGAVSWAKDRPPAAIVLWAMAGAIPLAGIASAKFLRSVYLGMSYAAYPIGFVVSHVVLAILYYAVLTPIGWLMKLGGYNPLARRFDRMAPTYWQPRGGPKTPDTYFRQS
jgi:hypothetical protein